MFWVTEKKTDFFILFEFFPLSMGDGVSYPIQLMDEDSTTLLGDDSVDCEAADNGSENVDFWINIE